MTNKGPIMCQVMKEYRYREGVHGEHCIDYCVYEWRRVDTIGRAVTKEDALKLVSELNALQARL
jgi:hypothetical protein